MSRSRFVQPATVRLALSDGDWVEAKARLTYGEQSRLEAAAFGNLKGIKPGQDAEVGFDFAAFQLARLQVFIVAWSFRDEQNRPVAVSRSAIEALDPDAAAEIADALERHLEAEESPKASSGSK